MTFNRYDYPTSKFLINAEAEIRKKSMLKAISEVLQEVEDAPDRAHKIEILRKNYKPAFNAIFESVFNPNVVWLLPEGPIDFTPSDLTDIEGRLYQESKKLYLFLQGGNPNLTNERRVQLFIQVLETVTPGDAKLLLAMKDKKMPFESVTPELVNEAFNWRFPVGGKETNVKDVQEAQA